MENVRALESISGLAALTVDMAAGKPVTRMSVATPMKRAVLFFFDLNKTFTLLS
jgi:hypothetical protein